MAKHIRSFLRYFPSFGIVALFVGLVGVIAGDGLPATPPLYVCAGCGHAVHAARCTAEVDDPVGQGKIQCLCEKSLCRSCGHDFHGNYTACPGIVDKQTNQVEPCPTCLPPRLIKSSGRNPLFAALGGSAGETFTMAYPDTATFHKEYMTRTVYSWSASSATLKIKAGGPESGEKAGPSIYYSVSASETGRHTLSVTGIATVQYRESDTSPWIDSEQIKCIGSVDFVFARVDAVAGGEAEDFRVDGSVAPKPHEVDPGAFLVVNEKGRGTGATGLEYCEPASVSVSPAGEFPPTPTEEQLAAMTEAARTAALAAVKKVTVAIAGSKAWVQYRRPALGEDGQPVLDGNGKPVYVDDVREATAGDLEWNPGDLASKTFWLEKDQAGSGSVLGTLPLDTSVSDDKVLLNVLGIDLSFAPPVPAAGGNAPASIAAAPAGGGTIWDAKTAVIRRNSDFTHWLANGYPKGESPVRDMARPVPLFDDDRMANANLVIKGGLPGRWKVGIVNDNLVRVWFWTKVGVDADKNPVYGWQRLNSNQVYSTDDSGFSIPMKVEGVANSTAWANIKMTASFSPDKKTSFSVTDSVVATVMDLDLAVDSDNSGDVDSSVVEDAYEEGLDPYPFGAFLPVNDQDGDNDGIPGFADGFNRDGVDSADDASVVSELSSVELTAYIPSDLDRRLFDVVIDYSQPSDPAGIVDGEAGILGVVPREPAAGALRLWRSSIARRSSSYLPPGTYHFNDIFGTTGYSTTLYAEAVAPMQKLNIKVSLVLASPAGLPPNVQKPSPSLPNALPTLDDKVAVSALRPDVDVDSDNANGLERSRLEETIEARTPASAKFPGLIVPLAETDCDFDGVPDFADGFDLETETIYDTPAEKARKEKDNSSGHPMLPVAIQIPDGVDLSKASLSIVYSASDPASVYRFGSSVYYKASGSLRLWKTCASSRNKKSVLAASAMLPEGDYVASGTYYPAALKLLGFSDTNRSVTLWLEGVGQSELGELSISVGLDPDGQGIIPAQALENDLVKISVLKPVDLDVDSDNDGTIKSTDLVEDGIEARDPGKYAGADVMDAADGLPGHAHGAAGAAAVPVSLIVTKPNAVPWSEIELEISYPAASPKLRKLKDDGTVEELAAGTALVAKTVYLRPDCANGSLRLWNSNGKFVAPGTYSEVTANGDPYWGLGGSCSGSVWTMSFKLEGCKAEDASQLITVRQRFKSSGAMLADSVKVTVVEADIDVDSDNNGSIEPENGREDVIEDWPGRFGKAVPYLGESDADKDGVPDFADGFDLEAAAQDDSDLTKQVKAMDNVSSHALTPVVIALHGNIDFTKAKLRLEYPASSPADVSRNSDGSYALGGAGTLRLWREKKDGDGKGLGTTARNKNSLLSDENGDFLPSGTYGATGLARLGFSAGTRQVTVWLEGVRPSSAPGDQRIQVFLDPDGDGPASEVSQDAVRITVMKADFDMDSDNADENDDGLDLERSFVEEQNESGDGVPGAPVPVAEGDADGDNITDFDDWNSTHRMAATGLDLPPAEDEEKATVSFVYAEAGLPESTFSKAGWLRLWKWEAGGERKAENLVPSGKVFTFKEWNAIKGDLKAEAVRLGAGDIVVTIDPDGAAGPILPYKETVKARALAPKAPFRTVEPDDGIRWVNSLEAGLDGNALAMPSGVIVVGGCKRDLDRTSAIGFSAQIHFGNTDGSDGAVGHGWLEIHKERPTPDIFSAASVHYNHSLNIRLELSPGRRTATVCMPDNDRIRFRLPGGSGAATAEARDFHRLRFLRLEREEGGLAYRLRTPEGSYLRFVATPDSNWSSSPVAELVTAKGRHFGPGTGFWPSVSNASIQANGYTLQVKQLPPAVEGGTIPSGSEIVVPGLYGAQPWSWKIENPDAATGGYDRVFISSANKAVAESYECCYDRAKNSWTVKHGADGDVRMTETTLAGNSYTTALSRVGEDQPARTVSREVNRIPEHDFPVAKVTQEGMVSNVDYGFLFHKSVREGKETEWKLPTETTSPDGAKATTAYDAKGRVTSVSSPWMDTNGGHKVEFSYISVDQGLDVPDLCDIRPRMVTERVNDTVVSRSWFVYGQLPDGDVIDIVEQAASAGASYGAAGNFRTSTLKYGSETSVERLRGMPKQTRLPDGSWIDYEYALGSYDSSGFHAGTGDSLKVTATSYRSLTPTAIPGKTMRSTAIVGPDGRPCQVVSESFQPAAPALAGMSFVQADPASWQPAGSNSTNYDPWGRVSSSSASNNVSQSFGWDMRGIVSSVGPDSIVNTLVRNVHDEVVRVDHGNNRSVFMQQLDAAGNAMKILAQGTAPQGGTVSEMVIRTVDKLGRTTSSVGQDQVLFKFDYVGLDRETKTTVPAADNAFVKEVRYLDGQVKSMSGTGTVTTSYDYGVDGQGGLWERAALGAEAPADAPAWIKKTSDFLGRPSKLELPASDNKGTVSVTVAYDSLGRPKSRTVSGPGESVPVELYEYDQTTGELCRQGEDLNGDGQLDPAVDRVVVFDTSVVGTEQQTTATVQDTQAPPDENGQQPVRHTVRKVRMANFSPGVTSEVSSTGFNGQTTTNTTAYVGGNFVVTSTMPGSSPAVETYSDGKLVSAVDEHGLTTTYAYDGLGRRVSATDSRGNTTTYAYNDKGQLASETDAAGNTTTYAYDTAGRLVCTTDPLGKTVRHAYDLRGNIIRTWGSAAYPTETAYDDLNRRTSLKTFQGGTGWEGADWPADTGTPSITAWNYDRATGLLLSKTDALGKMVSFEYDGLGRMKKRTRARGISTNYAYEISGRLSSISHTDGTPGVSYGYDRGTGLMTSVSDAAGTHAFAYNEKFQLVSETISGGLYAKSISRSYDEIGRLTGTGIAADGYQVNYGYDAVSRLVSVSSQGFGQAAADSWSLSFLGGSNLISQISGPRGLVVTGTYESARNLLTKRENKIGTTVVSSFSFTNDAIGRRSTAEYSGTAFGRTTPDAFSFGYNDRSELTWTGLRTISSSVHGETTSDQTWGYAYDSIGNRMQAQEFKHQFWPGGNAWPYTKTTSYQVNAANAYTSVQVEEMGGQSSMEPGYDDDGNMQGLVVNGRQWAYQWDAENRLSCASKTENGTTTSVACSYDSQSRRVRKVVLINGFPVRDTRFVYDGYHLIQELDGMGNNAVLRSYVWVDDKLGTMTDYTGEAPVTYTYLHDANRNVSELMGPDGGIAAHYDYDPFGKKISPSGSYAQINPFRFSNEYSDDDLGLVYYNFRYYSPDLGRWLSRDPMEEEGGLNLYGFVSNNTFGNVDMLGLWGVKLFGLDLTSDGKSSVDIDFEVAGAGARGGALAVVGAVKGVVEIGKSAYDSVGTAVEITSGGSYKHHNVSSVGKAMDSGDLTAGEVYGTAGVDIATGGVYSYVKAYKDLQDGKISMDQFSETVGGGGILTLVAIKGIPRLNASKPGASLTSVEESVAGRGATEAVAESSSERPSIIRSSDNAIQVGEDYASAEGQTVYRNVPEKHACIADAMDGNVSPRGKTLNLTPEERAFLHDQGRTEGSGFTSWSVNKSWILQRQKDLGGVVIEVKAPPGSIWMNQLLKGEEMQVLVSGKVKGRVIVGGRK